MDLHYSAGIENLEVKTCKKILTNPASYRIVKKVIFISNGSDRAEDSRCRIRTKRRDCGTFLRRENKTPGVRKNRLPRKRVYLLWHKTFLSSYVCGEERFFSLYRENSFRQNNL